MRLLQLKKRFFSSFLELPTIKIGTILRTATLNFAAVVLEVF